MKTLCQWNSFISTTITCSSFPFHMIFRVRYLVSLAYSSPLPALDSLLPKQFQLQSVFSFQTDIHKPILNSNNQTSDHISPFQSATPIHVELPVAKFDIIMEINQKNDNATSSHLEGSIHYRSNMWEKQTIEKIANCYLLVLKEMVNQPHQKVATNIYLYLSLEEYRSFYQWILT